MTDQSRTELSGKSVIVTGASRGIGEATVREMVELGCHVLAVARSKNQLDELVESLQGEKGSVCAMQCDVSDYSQVQNAVKECNRQFGSVNILINNAGVIEPVARLAESDPEAWTNAADINYKGVYYGLRAAIPEMLSQGSGVIINISSGAAYGALEGWSHYCSSKAAAYSLTKCADKEYRDQGIRVIGLSPGTVATEMQVAIKASGINPVSQLDPSIHIPTQWVAKTISWLCTSAASDYCGTDFSLKDEESKRLVGIC